MKIFNPEKKRLKGKTIDMHDRVIIIVSFHSSLFIQDRFPFLFSIFNRFFTVWFSRSEQKKKKEKSSVFVIIVNCEYEGGTEKS